MPKQPKNKTANAGQGQELGPRRRGGPQMDRGSGGHTLSPRILRASAAQAGGSERVSAWPRSHSGPVQGLEPGPRRTCQGQAGKTDPRLQPARARRTRRTPVRPRLGAECRTLRPTPSPRAPFLTSPASAAAAARLADPPQARPRPRRGGPAPNIFSREFAGRAAETEGAGSQCACALLTPPPPRPRYSVPCGAVFTARDQPRPPATGSSTPSPVANPQP